MADSITSQSMDDLFSSMPTGSLERAILNNLYGFNHRQTPGMVPINKEQPGLTFFVRPQLNMQADNIRNIRQLSLLLSNNPLSMQMYIRCMLDPRLMTGVSFNKGAAIPKINCPIVDNKSAFFPIFTNSFVSMSGWPDVSVPTFTSDPGLHNEAWSIVDGRVLNSETYDLNVNFRETRGNPVMLQFYAWALYMAGVFEGKLVPYLDMITENEVDYCTRIYRIKLDYKREIVTGIAACGAAFPTGLPIGEGFNVPGDKPFSEANQEITMRFKCMGVNYYDDILVKEFNETVAIFNPGMSDKNRSKYMMKIPKTLIQMFNFKGYPHINTTTSELEWYVESTDYSAMGTDILKSIKAGQNNEDFQGD